MSLDKIKNFLGLPNPDLQLSYLIELGRANNLQERNLAQYTRNAYCNADSWYYLNSQNHLIYFDGFSSSLVNSGIMHLVRDAYHLRITHSQPKPPEFIGYLSLEQLVGSSRIHGLKFILHQISVLHQKLT